MFTIFFDKNYWRLKKVFFTKSLKYSFIYDLVETLYYLFNKNVSNYLIFSGPQKLINYLLRIYKGNNNVTFNDYKKSNSYIVQFDSFGQSVLEKLVNKKRINSKILIGPLFNLNQLDILIKKMQENENIFMHVVSDSSKKLVLKYNSNIDKDRIVTIPIGVISENETISKAKRRHPPTKCLIYFKKRSDKELNYVINCLNEFNIETSIFKYGDYKNSQLLKAAVENDFGIIIDKTESQGFAIQELMSKNLPLFVWDYTENDWFGKKFKGTTVPYWSDECGIKFYKQEELKESLNLFLMNINKFTPKKFVIQNLSYENTVDKFSKFFNH